MASPQLQLAEALGHELSDKRMDILRRIAVCRSISEAARSAGVSYKAAWQAIETLSNLAGVALVEKVVGGSGGGGAQLTAAGERLIEASSLLLAARQKVLAQLAGAGDASLAAMALRTSMRNQFAVTVARLSPRAGLMRVELALPQGGTLHSRITHESCELLSLTVGKPVLALCKATAVKIAPHITGQEHVNLVRGQVSRASKSAGGGEMVLVLPGGLHMVGFADAGHGLTVGAEAMAGFEEAGVVLALPG